MRKTYSREQIEEIAHLYRNWGRWGEDDETGTANLVTPARVARAAQLVRTGKTYSLALPLDRTGPQTGRGRTGRTNAQHYMARTGGDIAADAGDVPQFDGTDDLVHLYLQAGTQWDALAHAFYGQQMYNGRTTADVTSAGALKNSITSIGNRAIGRGVLLDVARAKGVEWLDPGYAIDTSDLERCADAQGIEVGTGDFVLVRTGQIAETRARGDWGDYAGGDAPGLSVDAAHFLCSRDVAAVACDTWGLDVRPYESTEVLAPLHVVLLVNAGIHIGEMWDLEELASDCSADRVYEFFLSAPPLTITGAVGSPLNPVAVK